MTHSSYRTDGAIKLVTWRLGRKVSLIGERILNESGRDYFLFGVKKTDNSERLLFRLHEYRTLCGIRLPFLF